MEGVWGAEYGREEVELVDVEVAEALAECKGGLTSFVGKFTRLAFRVLLATFAAGRASRSYEHTRCHLFLLLDPSRRQACHLNRMSPSVC